MKEGAARSGEVLADRYRLEAVAGAGGMGVVHRAVDLVTGSPVAVKVLREASPPIVTRFQREGAVLRELDDPGIVRCLDHGATSTGELYLVMEWLDGEPLAARLAREPLSVKETLAVAKGIARALAVAHARGVVHRDVKPANLFLVGGDPGKVKVLDFGLAWMANAASRHTKTGVILGTPGYMAPEQALADRELDARADVFSLGTVLYECLAGRPPFVADHPMALFAKILFEDPPRVGTLREAVPPALDALVMSMLAKDREGRPTDARAVERALAPITSGADSRLVPAPTTAHATPSEKQLLCIVFVAPRATTRVEDPPIVALRNDLASYGASVEQLADGTLVAILAGRGAATDRATAAARCALTLRERLPERVIVLTTGLAVVDGRVPAGEVIDRAAVLLRARGASPTDGVWLDDVTAGLVGARFEVASRGGTPILLGAREELDDTRLLLGKPTPFVGRDRDLAFVLGLFEETVSERVGRAVLVTAPAGTGKSRLRHEVLRRIEESAPDAVVWFGRGDPVSVGAPFALLGPALRRAAGILDGEAAEIRRQKIRTLVGRHVPAASRELVAEFVAELASAPFPDAEASVRLRSARQSPMQMSDEVLRAWEELVRAECAAHPLVLVLEDLHWGDLPSVRFVDTILRSQSEAPVFVLALARPDVHSAFPRLWHERRVQELVLSELTKRAATTLARHALGPTAPDDVIARVVERAAGNAFYLEELVRAAADGKGPTSDTVLAMVQSRTDALPSQERRILRAASVFGEVFWTGGVAARCGTSAAAVDAITGELVRRELFVRRASAAFPSETELAFRHGLVREGAYATLTDEDRTSAHLAAGTWLERAGETNALVLAEHFERGGAKARAAAHYAHAARQAFEGGDLAHAIDCAERGMRAGPDDREVRAELVAAACDAYAWSGRWQEAADAGREVMSLSAPGTRIWSMAASATAFAGLTLGERAISFPVLEALVAVEPAPDARSALAWALSASSTIVHFTGGPRETALRMLERLETVTSPVVASEPWARANLERARAYAARYLDGDLGTSLAWTQRALASFEEAGDRATMALVALDLGTTLFRLGQLDRVTASMSALVEQADRFRLDTPGGFARIELARAACERGDAATVRACAEWVFAHQVPAGYQPAQAHMILAETARRSGDLRTAETEARRALALLAPTSSDALMARCTLARTRIAQGDAAEALRIAEENARQIDDPSRVKTDECRVFATLAEARLAAALDPKDALVRARDDLLLRASKVDPALRRDYLEALEVNRRAVDLVRKHLGDAPFAPEV